MEAASHPGACRNAQPPAWGSRTIYPPFGGDYDFMGSASYYLKSPWGYGFAHCEDVAGCFTCNGGFSIGLYAGSGNFSGTVYRLPEGQSVPNAYVMADPYNQFHTTADDAGHYDFAAGLAPPFPANNWALPVYGNVDASTSTGPGSGSYDLSAEFFQRPPTRATTTSSTNVPVDLFIWSQGEEEPSRCEDPSSNNGPGSGAASAVSTTNPPPPAPPGAPCGVGCPVSVTTGAVYFDQTDVTIPGLGPALRFVRSYNSQLRGSGQYGAFGPGWNHVYEQRLSFPTSTLIMLRKANGNPTYFQDNDANLTFEPSVPFTKGSTIAKQPDGTYIRSFRSGGTETYDNAGRLTRITDASSNAVTITWDGSGKLVSVAENGGRSLTVGYTGARITSLSGPAGVIATYGYDGFSRLQSVLYGDGSGYTFTYDDATYQLLTVRDPTGRTLETHLYDGSGRATTSEIASGQERQTLSYGTLQTTVTDALTHVTTYDFNMIWGGRYVTKITGPCSSCGSGNETQQWTYDQRGRIASHTNGVGKTTRYEYDPATGDLLKEIDPLEQETVYTYDSQGRVLTKTNPDGAVTTYTYGPAGPTSITEKVTLGTTRTTNISYTTQGRPETITDPRGKITTLVYNAQGDLTSVTLPPVPGSAALKTTFTYDTLGRRKTVKDAVNNTTSYDYDAQGRLTRVTDPALKATVTTYDTGGRRETVTDALNRLTRYGYDTYARLETVTDAAIGVTRYGYDVMSNLISLTDARSKVTTFEYDTSNRVKKVIWPGGGTVFETFTYDAAGRLATKTNRKSVVTTYGYDDLGRLTSKTYSDSSPAVAYTYDEVGRLRTAANGTDTLTWTYDLLGEVLSEDSENNTSLVEYAYDLGGNRLSVSLNGQVVMSYAYDEASRLKTMTRGTSNWTLAYDAASRRTSLLHPNTVTTTYGYDIVSRLTSAITKKANQNRTQSTYTYDIVGNRLTKGGDFNESYTYDALYQLTLVKRGNPTTESYTYDAVGNRLSALNSSPWTYDDRNELLSLPNTTLTYDLNGNMATKLDSSGSWSYVFDVEDQLVQVFKNSAEVSRFAYDPLGRRVEKVAGVVTRSYVYDGEDILRETSSSGSVLTYLHGPGIDEPLASEDGGGVRTYLHPDGLGSIVKTTNASGAAGSTFKYNAFGVIETGTPSPYAYTGREWDAEAGLYYYRARYYDPKIGRFLSEDPIDFQDGASKYPYALNNPTNLLDPDGQQATTPALCGGNCPHSVFTAFFNLCNMASKINIVGLRRCIQSKCQPKAVKITCDSTSCPGSGQPGYTPASNSVVICTQNPGAPNMMRLIMHELYVHACNPTGPSVPNPWHQRRSQRVIREATRLGF
jgi:RHS repeat-associated protein